MNNPYQSPEKARQSPEIKGGAAYEAIRRVYTINEAAKNVYNATNHLAEYIKSSKDLPMDAAYPAANAVESPIKATGMHLMEDSARAARAAVEEAHNNLENNLKEPNTDFSLSA
jgi:hypothetical protein